VRELENAVRRALVLGNDPIRSDDFALGRERQEVGLAAIEREAALRALAYSNGSITRAARALGIHRATLYRKLRAWGLSGRPGRDGSAPRA
jgi:transcriptional regulator of acetoin/glycerol metabolism